eukprot:2832608-Pyramimonas_sp.AAC.1
MSTGGRVASAMDRLDALDVGAELLLLLLDHVGALVEFPKRDVQGVEAVVRLADLAQTGLELVVERDRGILHDGSCFRLEPQGSQLHLFCEKNCELVLKRDWPST